MRIAALAPALALAAALAGCVTEERSAGRSAEDSAARAGWKVGGGDREAPAPAAREPGTAAPLPAGVVVVPVEAFAPVDLFFDDEGYLLGDRVEVDCSAEPFMGRFASIAAADASAKFVVREDGEDGDVRWVRLRNLAAGPAYQANLLPRATFASLRPTEPVVDPATGRVLGVNPRPFFEVVGSEEVLVRFHRTTSADVPVFFRARAVGTPSPLDPTVPRDAIYANVNRRRRVKGPELRLALEVRRLPDGRWVPEIRDPGSGPAGGAR